MQVLHVPNFSYGPSLKHNMSSSSVGRTSNTSSPTTTHRTTRARLVHGYGLLPYQDNVFLPEGIIEVDVLHMMTEKPDLKRAVMYSKLRLNI